MSKLYTLALFGFVPPEKVPFYLVYQDEPKDWTETNLSFSKQLYCLQNHAGGRHQPNKSNMVRNLANVMKQRAKKSIHWGYNPDPQASHLV